MNSTVLSLKNGGFFFVCVVNHGKGNRGGRWNCRGFHKGLGVKGVGILGV